jgi:very-short-patch-repair endonuclease
MPDYTRLAEHKNLSRDYRRAKSLRHEAPLAERMLWSALRESAKGTHIRFRRQQPIHPYIVDFVCLRLRLVIEVDGMSHDTRLEFDQRRDAYLKGLGYDIMRVQNEDVLNNCDGVVRAILLRAEELNSALVVPLP